MQLIPFTTTLKIDQEALVRDVHPEDKPLLEVGFEHLSPQSRYFRFLGGHSRLSEAELARFTAENDADQVAIGAMIMHGSESMPAGIARYVLHSAQSDLAEIAITIVDRSQGLGLGSLLIGVLAKYAALQGIREFSALVHVENHRMLGLLQHLGARQFDRSGAEIEFRLPILANPEDYPDNGAGNALRRAYALAQFDDSDAAEPTAP